jgi:YqaJ-like viral recombinase domain
MPDTTEALTIHECEQGTEAWRKVKAGIPSASSFSSIICPSAKWYVMFGGEEVSSHNFAETAQEKCAKLNKKNPGHSVKKTWPLSEGADDLINDLIAQRISGGVPLEVESYTSHAMQYGIDTEPEARQWYATYTRNSVRRVGFVTTADGRFGCSPDGLIEPDGGLELKCPLLKTHVGYLRDGGLPSEYKCQVHGCLAVTGAKWWDFVSFCHGAPPILIRVEPDDFTKALRDALDLFHERYDAEWKRIEAMMPQTQEEPADVNF